MGNADALREAVKNHPPYVVPCIDMTFATIENDDEPYLHAIPYMQFPMLQAGKPFTGERGMIPGVAYVPTRISGSSAAARPGSTTRPIPTAPTPTAAGTRFPSGREPGPRTPAGSKQYLPLVEEGTWAWLEIGDSDLLPNRCQRSVASVFANRELYLVLANYGRSPAAVATTDAYVPSDKPTAAPAKQWNLPPRTLEILRRSA